MSLTGWSRLARDIYHRRVAEADRRRLVYRLGELTARERRAIDARYGLGSAAAATYREVGLSLGVSASQARRVTLKALEQLRRRTVGDTHGRVELGGYVMFG